MFSVLAVLLLSVAAAAKSTQKFQNWSDCGSTGVDVWGVNVEPRPQVLGENWTIYYVFVPTMDITEDLNLSVLINVTYKGAPFHTDLINLCNPGDAVAISDGFGKCPYLTGIPVTIHDTNVVPNFPFIPTGPFNTVVKYFGEAEGLSSFMCLTLNQTYVRPSSK